jgi:hypothetical protein
MKAALPLLCGSLVLLGLADAGAQSDRLGGRINDRVGGRINEGTASQPRGLYGPDPYVGPGAVSPFGQSPVVPLRSAPVQSAPNPYISRYPSTQSTDQEPSLTNRPVLQPAPDVVPKDTTPMQRPAAAPESPRQPSREQRLDTKVGGAAAKPDQPAQKPSDALLGGGAAREGLSPRKVKEKPCANGRTRARNGECTGPLRPK